MYSVSLGEDYGCGNLLGVQPVMRPADYASARAYRAALNLAFTEAFTRGWVGSQTIIVLPEYIGTWLVVAGAPAPVFSAATLRRAMAWMIASNGPEFLLALTQSHSKNRVAEAVFRMRASAMAHIHHAALADLAGRYGVTIVGGSLVLPSPYIEQGVLRAGHGPLRNVCPVYRPDGTAYPALIQKVFPIREELDFTGAGSLDALSVIETPAGWLGVAICADSWYPQIYAALRAQGADLLAVPGYLSPSGVWDQPWGGYNPGPPPADVDPADIGALSEGEAWRRYALVGRAPHHSFTAGVSVFLRGALWDRNADGKSRATLGKSWIETEGEASLVNVWLPPR